MVTDLRDLGLSLGHRRKLLKAIAEHDAPATGVILARLSDKARVLGRRHGYCAIDGTAVLRPDPKPNALRPGGGRPKGPPCRSRVALHDVAEAELGVGENHVDAVFARDRDVVEDNAARKRADLDVNARRHVRVGADSRGDGEVRVQCWTRGAGGRRDVHRGGGVGGH